MSMDKCGIEIVEKFLITKRRSLWAVQFSVMTVNLSSFATVVDNFMIKTVCGADAL